MKKLNGLLFSAAALLLLSACANTPDETALQATIQAAVDQAVSEYSAKLDTLVDEDTLAESQKQQNMDIQDYITEQFKLREAQETEVYPEDPVTYPEKTERDPYDDENGNDSSDTVVSDGPCDNRFEYVSDLNVPDGTDIPKNSVFPKSWYIKNTGTCVWNSGYKMVYQSGDEVGTAKTFDILNQGEFFKPGESMMVSVQLAAPNIDDAQYITHWAVQSDKGEMFGAGTYQNVYLRSDFITSNQFDFTKNFSSASCSDDNGYFSCGKTDSSDGRGAAFYDPSPTLESRRVGQPSFVIAPPAGANGKTRVEFGPIRMPMGSWFYSNFCCRPDTDGCDVTVRLYVREPGYQEVLLEEAQEWNDGYMGEWKFTMESREQFNQDLYYIFEVEANGTSDQNDLIVFQNTRVY